jgi:hypothetical protein
VQKLVDRYVAEKRFQRLRTAKQTERRLRFMDWKAADIRRRDLREQCDKIAAKGLLREAGHPLQVISPLFKWAVSRDLIEVGPVVGLSAGDYSLGEVRDCRGLFGSTRSLRKRHALV